MTRLDQNMAEGIVRCSSLERKFAFSAWFFFWVNLFSVQMFLFGKRFGQGAAIATRPSEHPSF